MSNQSGQEEDYFDVQIVNRNQKVIETNLVSESKIRQITNKAQFKSIYNGNIDQRNEASKSSIEFKINKLHDQKHYFMNNKVSKVKKNLLDEVRSLVEERGYDEPSWVAQKCGLAILVVQFVYFKQKMGILDSSIFEIEDNSGKENIVVKNGIVWTGMICAIEASFENGQYRLKRVLNLGTNVQSNGIKHRLLSPIRSYRMLMLKAPFKQMNGDENIGCILLYQQLIKLSKLKSGIDCIFIMGPFIHRKNTLVANCQLEKSNQEEFESTVQAISEKVKKYFPSAKIVLMPSTQEVFHSFPIPQPAFEFSDFNFDSNIRSLSNPGSLDFYYPSGSFSIDFLNYDLLDYIDNHKGGMHSKEVLQENLQTYFKTPFLTTNLVNQPIDQMNLQFLYNAGKFADILVMSSKISPPFAREINGRLVINIGNLGVQKNSANKHFMTLMSIYEGEGPVAFRTKVESIAMDNE